MVAELRDFGMTVPSFLLAFFLFSPTQQISSSILLDDFSTLSRWKAIVSDGARLALRLGEGRAGKSMVMEFDLSGGAGYVIAEKPFPLDLPANYQFTFDLRAEAPVNNFEFKIIDEFENVHWIKRMNMSYPTVWTKQRIKKRHLSFAWGPEPGRELRHVRRLQFVVSAGTGGAGKVEIGDFRFEPLDDSIAASAIATVVGHGDVHVDPAGTTVRSWHSTPSATADSLVIDFHRSRELGGLIIDWAPDFARSYEISVSDDGESWTSAYAVRNGKPGRAYIPLGEAEGSFLKLVVLRMSSPQGAAIHRMEIRDPTFSSSTNNLYRVIARDAGPGRYPKYFLDRQSYWTVIGVNGDTKEALMNEEGQIEVDRLQFSLEPFLFIDGKLLTWSDVSTTPSLCKSTIPIPSVTWRFKDQWTLTVRAVATGEAGNSILGIRYSLRCTAPALKGKLFVAIRPFQVNPPWQALNIEGGTSRIDSISFRSGVAYINGIALVPMTEPSAFGAQEFDQGDITDYLARGELPKAHDVWDHFGHASAGFAYPFDLARGQMKEVDLAVPFHGWDGHRTLKLHYAEMLQSSVRAWERDLRTIQISLPLAGRSVARTVSSNLAYILINRDGPRIQPGSRSYERSWIRDGSLTCAALLRLGHQKEVREFIDWYARGQFPSGKIPCVIDNRGSDPVPENDSHGEFLYAVRQYFLFSHDTAWLRGKFDAVVKTVRYIQGLRAERKTEVYRTGTAEQRACYGLVPASISHEGYSSFPRHSYWDDFFVLRGLKDAAAIAEVLGEEAFRREFAEERVDFQKDLYASMRLAIRNTGIDYIPGCVELGDFDATSTTVGLIPTGELGNLPEPELHNTFDRYFAYFEKRKVGTAIINYTPYEARIIGSFVLLGQKERATELMQFLMKDRRPPAWNHWAEVVWRDPSVAKYIGDMPHTWVGSDFIRSVLTMFVYDRESDGAHVLCAGIPDAWIKDSAGVRVERFQTYFGDLSYSLHVKGKSVVAEVSGGFDAEHHPLVMKSPLLDTLRSVLINGMVMRKSSAAEVSLTSLPASVEWRY